MPSWGSCSYRSATSSHGWICGGERRCVCGLLGPVSCKNGWQLAEYAGWRRPDGQQHLLDRAKWDVDELRDRVRRYALDGLAGSGGGVPVDVSEAGLLRSPSTAAQTEYPGPDQGLGGMCQWDRLMCPS
jgi:hypothetical protein